MSHFKALTSEDVIIFIPGSQKLPIIWTVKSSICDSSDCFDSFYLLLEFKINDLTVKVLSQKWFEEICKSLLAEFVMQILFWWPDGSHQCLRVIRSDLVWFRLYRSGLCCSGDEQQQPMLTRSRHQVRGPSSTTNPWSAEEIKLYIYLSIVPHKGCGGKRTNNTSYSTPHCHKPVRETSPDPGCDHAWTTFQPESDPTSSRTSLVSAATMWATVKLLIWGSCRTIAQAVTSGNEWLTYKGVSLHISAGGGGGLSDRNTPESRVSPVRCCQSLSSSITQDLESFMINQEVLTAFWSILWFNTWWQ